MTVNAFSEYLKKHGKLKSTAKTWGASVFYYAFRGALSFYHL